MGSMEHLTTRIREESAVVAKFCLGDEAEDCQMLLESTDSPTEVKVSHMAMKIPEIVVTDGPQMPNGLIHTEDKAKIHAVPSYEENGNMNRNNNANEIETESNNNQENSNEKKEFSIPEIRFSETALVDKIKKADPGISDMMEHKTTQRAVRKYSLPGNLSTIPSMDPERVPLQKMSSQQKMDFKHRTSVFGDLGIEEHDWVETKSSHDGFKSHLFSFFQASDNKLAMKLFGSRSALLKEKKRQFDAHSWIIHPCSNFRLYWDLLMLIFLVTNLIVLPVAIAFFFNDMGSHWMVFNITCDVLFILDIIINFRTGLIDQESHGDVILDGKIIAIRYLKGWFIVDFFSSLPLDYMFLTLEGQIEGQLYTAGRAIKILRLTKILQLLRLLRISRLVRYIKLWQEYFSLASIVVRIFNLICVMVLLSHWSGCIQFAVPVFQGWPEDSWISMEKLYNVHWFEQYTKSLFKALSHMLCIGYGQYPPRNTVETWLTVASMLAGASCYALFVGHTTALIQSFDSSSRQFRDHLQQVNEYMSFRKLPPELRQKITSYYDHRFGGKMFNERDILSELSDSLRTDIINHNCKELVQTVPFFINADPDFVNDVISKLEFEMFQPGDIIVKAGTKGHKMYFIQEGIVEVVGDDDRLVTRLADGSYFGEISLLTNTNRTATIRAESYCNLFSLDREHFDTILGQYPVMRRTLETIAAQRLNHLGKDPALLSSRESLLEDLDGFQKVIQVSRESASDDEDEDNLYDAASENNNQFLTAVKGFFTKDSENFPTRSRSRSRQSARLSRSPSPLRSSKNFNNNNRDMNRCKSNLQYLVAPVVLPMSRRARSSTDLQSSRYSTRHSCNSTGLDSDIDRKVRKHNKDHVRFLDE